MNPSGKPTSSAARPATAAAAAPEQKTQKKGKGRAAAELDEAPLALGRQKSVTPDLAAAHEHLFHAIDGFIRANCNFESSVPVNAAIDDIGKSTSLQEAFTTPLQRQLFNMDSALRWVLFLAVAPERAEKEGDAPFAPGSFSSQEALALVSQVYDIGVQETVWEHFEPEEDEEDDAEAEAEADAE
jgi:hypothetical protein